jgi:hypothetical protein
VTNKLGLTLDEKIFFLYYMDPVDPAQYLATFQRNTHFEPEKALMLAVLEDAVACIQKYRQSSDAKEKRVFRDTKNWTDNDDWVFSFNNVCETLGLAPGLVRRALIQVEEGAPECVQ